jgi:hypothetical protein
VPSFLALQKRAAQGHLGMDKYAKLLETEEFKSKEGADELIRTCQSTYTIKPESGRPNLDFSLWNHEITCHTDKIRERWIENFQETYCKKHPNDLKSCQAKKKNLCDFYKFKSSSPSEQGAQSQKFFCEKISSAPATIRNYYSSMYGDLKALCVSVLSKQKTEL